MKSRICINLVLLVLIGSVWNTYPLGDARAQSQQSIKRLQLQMQGDKERYLPGEVITLSFKISNNTIETLMFEPGANVLTGRLQVFVSEGNEGFLEYRGPRWGLLDGFPQQTIELSPQQSVETNATVLYNYVVATYHLDERSAKKATKGLIKTEYALPRPGVYYIKARLFDKGFANQIESEPIKILIEDPQGFDLEIWNTIKNNGAYAYFLQTGEGTGNAKDLGTEEIVNMLEMLMERYPTTKYIDSLRASLAKRQSLEKAINKNREK